MPKYTVVQFPITSGGNNFIEPVFIQGRNIGLPNPFAIVDVSSVLASQKQLNGTANAAADKHLTVAALDSILPVPYGNVWAPALLANAVSYGGNWHFWCLWGAGPIDDVEQIYLNNAPPGFGFSETKLGEFDQTIIGALFLPMTVWYQTRTGDTSTSFDQTAPGVAHSDVIAPVGDIQQPPQINAKLRGRKIYDPRDGGQDLNDPTTWLYSRNPALILADFLSSARYGANELVDWDTVAAVADDNDDYGRTADFYVDKQNTIANWVATMQQAANCFLTRGPDGFKFVSDNFTEFVTPALDHANGNVISVSNELFEDPENQPTVSEVIYTDKTGDTWADASAPLVKVPGVDEGTVPWRKTSVRMPWIDDVELAGKEAALRLNKLRRRNPKMTIEVMDEGLVYEVGDRFEFTYPDSGYNALPVKVANIKPTANGYALGCFKDNEDPYIDTHAIIDTTPPILVPPVTNLNAFCLDGGSGTTTYTFTKGGIFEATFTGDVITEGLVQPDVTNIPPFYDEVVGTAQLAVHEDIVDAAVGTPFDVLAEFTARIQALPYPARFGDNSFSGCVLQTFGGSSWPSDFSLIDYNSSGVTEQRGIQFNVPVGPYSPGTDAVLGNFNVGFYDNYDWASQALVTVEISLMGLQTIPNGASYGYLAVMIQNRSGSTITNFFGASGASGLVIELPFRAVDPDAPTGQEFDLSFVDAPNSTTTGTPVCVIHNASGTTMDIGGDRHTLTFKFDTASLTSGANAQFMFPVQLVMGDDTGWDVPAVFTSVGLIPTVTSDMGTTPATSMRLFTNSGRTSSALLLNP